MAKTRGTGLLMVWTDIDEITPGAVTTRKEIVHQLDFARPRAVCRRTIGS